MPFQKGKEAKNPAPAVVCPASFFKRAGGCRNSVLFFTLHSSLVESVIFPAGATKIGARAFMGCSSLYDVRLPDNAEVNSDMFNGCKISVIALPASITKYVGNAIFKNCNGENLTTVFYFGTPEQLERADYIGFKYASSLYYYNESPSFNKTNTAYEVNYWHYDSNNEPVLWNENTV